MFMRLYLTHFFWTQNIVVEEFLELLTSDVVKFYNLTSFKQIPLTGYLMHFGLNTCYSLHDGNVISTILIKVFFFFLSTYNCILIS
jgi:hypothetical protein